MATLSRLEATHLVQAHCRCLFRAIRVRPRVSTGQIHGIAVKYQLPGAVAVADAGGDHGGTGGRDLRLALEVLNAIANCEGYDPETNFDFWRQSLGAMAGPPSGFALTTATRLLPFTPGAFSHCTLHVCNHRVPVVRQLVVDFFQPLPSPWAEQLARARRLLEPFFPRGRGVPELDIRLDFGMFFLFDGYANAEQLAAMLVETDEELRRQEDTGRRFRSVEISNLRPRLDLLEHLQPRALTRIRVTGFHLNQAPDGRLDPEWMQTLRTISFNVDNNLRAMPLLIGVCAGIPHATQLIKLKIDAAGPARKDVARDEELAAWFAFALLHPYTARELNSFRAITLDGHHIPGHLELYLPVAMASDTPLSNVAAKVAQKNNWKPARLGSMVTLSTTATIYEAPAAGASIITRTASSATTVDLIGTLMQTVEWLAVVVPWYGLGWVRSRDANKDSIDEYMAEIVRPPPLQKMKIRVPAVETTTLAETWIGSSARNLVWMSRYMTQLPLSRCRDLLVLKLSIQSLDLMDIVRGYDELGWPLQTLVISTSNGCSSQDEFLNMLMDRKRVGARIQVPSAQVRPCWRNGSRSCKSIRSFR